LPGGRLNAGNSRYLLHRRKAGASEDASYDCLIPASKIKSGREICLYFRLLFA